MKLSNKLTLTRVLFAPIFMVIYFIPIWIKTESISPTNMHKVMGMTNFADKFAAISICILIPLLIFAEFTDFLDGYFARKHNEVSDFGKLFDPFADVILHLTTFTCLLKSYDFSAVTYYTPIIVLILIMIREYSQNFLRMIAVKKGIAIGARKGGKFKTVMYVVTEFWALFLELLVRLNIWHKVPFYELKIVSIVLFVICVICSYASFIDYLVHFGKVLKESE